MGTTRRTAAPTRTRSSRTRVHPTKGTAVTSPDPQADADAMAKMIIDGSITFEEGVAATLTGRKPRTRRTSAAAAPAAPEVAEEAAPVAQEEEAPAPQTAIQRRMAELASAIKPKAAPKAAGTTARVVTRRALAAPEGEVEGEQAMRDLLADLRDSTDAGTTARLRRERDVLLDEIMSTGLISMRELIRRCFGPEAPASSFTTAMQKRGAAIRAASEGEVEETPAPAPAPAPAASKVVPPKARTRKAAAK